MNRVYANFVVSESGAVTVDWVVLTASVVGLGLAVMSVVSGGMERLSEEIASSLAAIEIQDRFAEALEAVGFASLDFSGQTGGFSGGALVTFPGLGDVLQIGPGQTARASFDMPAGTGSASVDFDLFGLDSLNNETATISVNGSAVGTVTVNEGVATFAPAPGGTATFEAVAMSGGSDLSGNGQADSWTQVRLTVDSPGESVDIAIHSGAGAGADNESFAIDNMSLSAR